MATEEMNLWLSPGFLSPIDETLYEHAVNFPDEFPYEFDSFTPDYALNSPLESTSCANEAESCDDDEFFTAVPRLHDSRAIRVPHSTGDLPEIKKWGASGSPQSIVSGLGVSSGGSSMSSNESPTGHSHLPSPLKTPCLADNSTFDLLYEVAGQVARLKLNSEATKYSQSNYAVHNLNKCNRCCLSPIQRPSLILSPVQPNVRLHQNLAQHQRAGHLHPFESRRISDFVRQEKLYQLDLELQKERIERLERGIEYEILRAERAWSFTQPSQVPLHSRRTNHPPLFKCPASSVSSKGITNVRRESSGTGVFLPRGYGNLLPPRNNSGCPPALPPEIVRAMNMNCNIKKNPVRSKFHGVLSASNPLNREILLPQEWTY